MLRIISRNYSTKPIKSKEWKTVVGLEVHAQIQSNSKLFSGSQISFNAPLNSRVSLFDAAIPGTLPVLNERCVEAGIKTASALNCKVNSLSMFDRKHYFYSDLPTGYQITQQRAALANNGVIKFPVFTPGVNKKPYTKEEFGGFKQSRNSLMELVFDHTLEDGDEASSLVKELILILKSLGTCSGKMEGKSNQFRGGGEINRQIEIKSGGGEITNETRNWDATLRKTVAMRDKEIQQDYRFMPESNLPMLLVDTEPDDKIRGNFKLKRIVSDLPKLPAETRKELVENFGLPEETAIIIVVFQ
uniref:Aspartyl/Glutamyl-tRNA(Gln) amidotransferase subunit B/E catalytic domain-containing protein n=1 Tax=Megaselia scalaris TaxID=36166 RepID=T1GS12_MEGSC